MTFLETLSDIHTKTSTESGGVNGPNLWCDEHNQPCYIIGLLKRIVGLSMETMKIVKALSKLGF